MESIEGFNDVQEIINAVLDEKYNGNFDEFQKDDDIVNKLKRTSQETLEEASKEIYEKYIENDQAKITPEMKKFLNCVFNFLKELENFKDKMV